MQGRINKSTIIVKDFNNPQSIINRISESKVSRDIADIMLNSKRLNAFPLRLRKRQICPLSPLFVSIIREVPGRAIRQGKEAKSIQIEKEKIKLSLFAGNMIIYAENPKGSKKKELLEQINKHRKDTGYKFNMQKLIKFPYTNR